MDKDYFLFNCKSVIANLKNKHDGDEEYEDYNKFIKGVDDNSAIEELPFFQDYLSLFDVEKAFEGYTFAAIHDNDIKVYINGQLVWEDYNIGGIHTSHLDASFFQEGENQLAIFFWGQCGWGTVPERTSRLLR